MIISIENLTKEYKSYTREPGFWNTMKSLIKRNEIILPALKGISLNIEAGELVGLLGPNGAGKSTAMKILSGVLYPTRGTVKVLDFIPWKQRKKYVAHIGVVFGQKSQLIWDIPPVDAFQMNRDIYGISHKDFNYNLDSMVELLGVAHVIKKPTRQHSLGERMKCEFIMAMLHNPQIVFLDEPTIGLDVLAKDNIRQFILEKNGQGTTFILTTHDIDDVEHLAKRVVVLNHGDIVFDDSLDVLRSYLGRRKIVKLTTREPFRQPTLAGINITKQLSDFDVELDLDLTCLELNDFMKMVGEKNIISDLSVQELPVEEIIKELYREQGGVTL